MRKQIFAGGIGLATLGLLLLAAPPSYAGQGAGYSADEIAAVDVARVKRVLHLTPEQEPYWPPVEAALRDIARRQTHAEPESFVRRVSHRVVSVVLNAAAVQRLAHAARPLIARLRDDQKQEAMALAQEMGLGPVLAALN